MTVYTQMDVMLLKSVVIWTAVWLKNTIYRPCDLPDQQRQSPRHKQIKHRDYMKNTSPRYSQTTGAGAETSDQQTVWEVDNRTVWSIMSVSVKLPIGENV